MFGVNLTPGCFSCIEHNRSYHNRLLISIAISGALPKYFGASSATDHDEPSPSSATQASPGMVSTLQDELPSMSSATQISPQKSDIENEDLFASTSPQHEPSGGFLHTSACVCVCGEVTRQLDNCNLM